MEDANEFFFLFRRRRVEYSSLHYTMNRLSLSISPAKCNETWSGRTGEELINSADVSINDASILINLLSLAKR